MAILYGCSIMFASILAVAFGAPYAVVFLLFVVGLVTAVGGIVLLIRKGILAFIPAWHKVCDSIMDAFRIKSAADDVECQVEAVCVPFEEVAPVVAVAPSAVPVEVEDKETAQEDIGSFFCDVEIPKKYRILEVSPLLQRMLFFAMHNKYIPVQITEDVPYENPYCAKAQDTELTQLQKDEDEMYRERRLMQLNARLDRLYAKKDKMEFLGTNKGTRAWRGLLYDIQQAKTEKQYWER